MSSERSGRSEWWCIKDFIDEAAKPMGGEGKTVPIRSSIPVMAKDATTRAEKAEASARKAENWVKGIAVIGVTAIVISLWGLGSAFYANIQSAYNAIVPQVDTLQRDVAELRSLTARLDVLAEENRTLRERVRRLEGTDSEVDR